MSDKDERVLAVILHADVVGSTELVRQNETVAHGRIQHVFQRLSEVIESHGGLTRELRGDALLAEFSRASDAVCAALRFQNANKEMIYPDDMHPQLRIGIAMGEVVTADNTLTGPGVVLSQRLEQIAEPGGVCIQGAAYETLPGRLPFEYESLGEQSYKGFSDPVRAFKVQLKADAEVPQPSGSSDSGIDQGENSKRVWTGVIILTVLVALATVWQLMRASSNKLTETAPTISVSHDQLSIAVLPFDNLSGDPEQNYFADGLADDLITDLSKISGLFVTARNSSFAYRDDERNISEIAALLGVRYLLDGSVRRANAQVRINAQLIDASTGKHIWSERFDQELENIFEIQDQVTQEIVSALELNLDTHSGNISETSTFEAYDVLLKALEVQSRFTPQDNAEGRDLFSKAAKLDPSYARAHAGVGLTHAIDVNMNWTENQKRSIDLGLIAVKKALELDPELSRAYFAKGSLLLAAGQHAESEIVMRRAVEITPNYADGFAQLAFVLVMSGKHDEALDAIGRGNKLNPLSSTLYLYVESMALFHLGRFEEALPLLEAAAERNPAFDRVQLMRSATLAYLGQLEEAEWALEEAVILSPGLSLEDERVDSIFLVTEDLERYLKGLRIAGLDQQ